MQMCGGCDKRSICWLPCHDREMEVLKNSRKLGRPFILVAAFNSPKSTKDDADFVCDGDHDEKELNKAIQLLGDRVEVRTGSGDFNVGGSIIGKPIQFANIIHLPRNGGYIFL